MFVNQINYSTYRIIHFNIQFGAPLTTSFVCFHKFFPNPALKVKFDIQELLLIENCDIQEKLS